MRRLPYSDPKNCPRHVVTLPTVSTAVLMLSVFIPVKENRGLNPGIIRANILNNLYSYRRGCPAAILLRYSAGFLRITTARVEHNHVLSAGLAKHNMKNRKIPKEISPGVMSLAVSSKPAIDIVGEIKGKERYS